MTHQVTVGRRAGGRAARHELRSTPISAEAAPIRPGHSGGQLRLLSEREIERIHRATLDVLERVGMGDAPEAWRERVTAKGGHVMESGRLSFPRALVEDTIAGAGRNFVLHGRDPAHDLDLSGTRVHTVGGSGTVEILDPKTNSYRETTLLDLYDIVRLEDALDNIHVVIRPCVARDLEGWRVLDLNTAYATMSGTTKPMGTVFYAAKHVKDVVALLDMSLGGDGSGQRFRARPFAHAITTIVSPLRFAGETCEMLDEMVRHGMPAIVTSAGQAGATSPVDLAGAVMQGNAEVLAAMVCMNLLSPGHPVLFGNGPFVSDLRTGAFAGGGGEMALLTAASAQMANFYDLPSGIGAGMTSSKQPDAQAGWEKGYLAALAGLAGVNMIYQSAGILADVMAISPEMMVIDAEMTAGALRAVRGIEVSDEALSVDTIAEVVAGPGHFLGHPRTLDLMETEYVYPDLACRRSIRDWEDAGSSDMRKRARARMEEILSSHYPAHVAPADDARIRDAFPINLAPEDMRPGNGRW